jgi:hypothetical protein
VEVESSTCDDRVVSHYALILWGLKVTVTSQRNLMTTRSCDCRSLVALLQTALLTVVLGIRRVHAITVAEVFTLPPVYNTTWGS